MDDTTKLAKLRREFQRQVLPLIKDNKAPLYRIIKATKEM